jgi:glycerophosphoryl diester phosphodiesterase
VIAHRGASWDEPENTLRAFERAIEVGADYVELDVQATRDGALVVEHDLVTETLAELRRRRPDAPTLAQALELCAGRVGVAAELKHPHRHRRHRLTERVLEALDELDPAAVLVVSFERGALRKASRLRPRLRLIQHVARVPLRAAAGYAWGAGFADRAATPRRLTAARRLGLARTVYTVNDPDRMLALSALGVEAVFTDRPDLALESLG